MKRFLAAVLLSIIIPFWSVGSLSHAPKLLLKEVSKVWGISPSFQSLENLDNGFFVILDEQNSSQGFLYIGRVNCSKTKPKGNKTTVQRVEYFDYFILFDKMGHIQKVRIYNYQCSRGHEITAKSWLKQFEGYTKGQDLETGKNVDAVSGATISVNAIIADIQRKTANIHQTIMKGEIKD